MEYKHRYPARGGASPLPGQQQNPQKNRDPGPPPIPILNNDSQTIVPKTPGSPITMEITNVVATATLTTPLDLEYLQQRLEGSVLQKTTGHWLKYRLQPENRYIAFYKSGKFLITGKGVIESLDSLTQRILALIHTAGIDAEILRVDINNIVAKDTLPLRASLETVIAVLDPQKAEYEPEQFPALIYKDWGVTFLLFSSGSVIITGARSVDVAHEALREFEKRLARIR